MPIRCGWCEQSDYVELSGKPRCNFVKNLKASGCKPENINPQNPESEATITKEKPLGTGRRHQIYPQEINVKLRPKSPTKFKVIVKVCENIGSISRLIYA